MPIAGTRLRRIRYFISRECSYFSIVQTYRFGSNPSHSDPESQSFRFSGKIFSRYALIGGPEKISPPGPEPAVGGPALATSSLGSNTVLSTLFSNTASLCSSLTECQNFTPAPNNFTSRLAKRRSDQTTGWQAGVRIPTGVRNFSLLQNVQVHPAPYSVSTGILPRG